MEEPEPMSKLMPTKHQRTAKCIDISNKPRQQAKHQCRIKPDSIEFGELPPTELHPKPSANEYKTDNART